MLSVRGIVIVSNVGNVIDNLGVLTGDSLVWRDSELRLQVIVTPGPTTASTSEAESDASPAMDSLVEGVAGLTGYFNIQVTKSISTHPGKILLRT